MSRESTGSVYESPKGSGRWHGKFTTPRGRRSVRLHACRTVEEATRHKAFIVEQLERLNSAGQTESASKLLELSGKAEPGGLARVKQGVDAIVTGKFKRPTTPTTITTADDGPTFAEFARRWTSGELRRDHRDHVAEKRSVQEDIYRLEAGGARSASLGRCRAALSGRHEGGAGADPAS